jgi:hypothetical protein
MEFVFTTTIQRALGDVYGFFRDVDRHAAREGTAVLAYDKITPGPVEVGARYREVVQILPFARGEIVSEVTCYEPPHALHYKFSGLGMEGELEYRFEQERGGVRIVQRQVLRPRGIVKLFGPLIRKMFSRAAGRRLEAIKVLLEGAEG